ncbi:MAG: hypothetical protein ACLVK0_13790 [Parabacteroides merdae]
MARLYTAEVSQIQYGRLPAETEAPPPYRTLPGKTNKEHFIATGETDTADCQVHN